VHAFACVIVRNFNFTTTQRDSVLVRRYPGAREGSQAMQARSRYEIKRRKKETSDSLVRSRCLSFTRVSDLFVSAVCVCLCVCVVCCVVCVCVFDSVCVFVFCVNNILDSGSRGPILGT